MQNRTIKFYHDPNNKTRNLSEYVFCIRPCDDNMSLKAFMPNGEICGYASEGYDSWVEGVEPIKEIDPAEFIFHFVQPAIKNTVHKRIAQDIMQIVEEVEQGENGWHSYTPCKLIIQKIKEKYGVDTL